MDELEQVENSYQERIKNTYVQEEIGEDGVSTYYRRDFKLAESKHSDYWDKQTEELKLHVKNLQQQLVELNAAWDEEVTSKGFKNAIDRLQHINDALQSAMCALNIATIEQEIDTLPLAEVHKRRKAKTVPMVDVARSTARLAGLHYYDRMENELEILSSRMLVLQNKFANEEITLDQEAKSIMDAVKAGVDDVLGVLRITREIEKK